MLSVYVTLALCARLSVFRVLYFYLTRMALDIFNCLPTTPPDGTTYMAGLLQYPCGGAVQKAMLFPAIVAFAGYSIAAPAFALWFLRSKKNIVKYDMVRLRNERSVRLLRVRQSS